ncbi:MAG TPA: helix-turn-helix domain-containing protein [Myxococcaceae bacterium]|nr:helix-turn-helix domain-containing protein [Myxococcaceae bacterium]
MLVGYRDADGLDLFGPAEVFAEAGRRLEAPVYELVVSAVGGGRVTLTSGLSVAATDLSSIRPQPDDIVIVAGGSDEAIDAAGSNRVLIAWLTRAARTVSRMASVCDGAFVLASAGLLDGKRAATHWYSCERLARLHPKVHVDREAIFVHDGRIWTAAGVSTGIDMALAMVEEDHGRKVADAVAAHLVLFARRPGFQSQFSEELVAQTLASDPLGPVITWMRSNLRAPLDVPTVAHRAGMAVRTFHRSCLQALDLTPAKLVEKLRVEHARSLLTTTRLGTKVIAARSGFGTAPRMTQAFLRALGVTPGAYRLMFSRHSTAPSGSAKVEPRR